MSDMKTHVETLIKKAAEAETSGSMSGPDAAMKYSQAALNAANAMCAVATEKTIGK